MSAAPRYLLTSCNKEAVEGFWLRVAQAIYERYGDRDDLKVYIHGDGAAWSRAGLETISRLRVRVLNGGCIEQ